MILEMVLRTLDWEESGIEKNGEYLNNHTYTDDNGN